MELSSQQNKKGWWIETRSTIPCALDKEGLIAKFYLADVQNILDTNYPSRMLLTNEKIWFFNKSYDREIAEQDGKFVYANPQLLLRHFMKAGG